jgi:hypothetical protein
MFRGLSIVLVVTALSGVTEAGPFVNSTLTDRAALHVLRIGGGLKIGRWAVRASFDPQAYTDGQHTLDVTGEVVVGRNIAMHVGWRDTSIDVVDGTRQYHSAVLGASAPMVKTRNFELRGGVELTQLVVAHGGGGEARWFEASPIQTFPLGLFIEGRYVFF